MTQPAGEKKKKKFGVSSASSSSWRHCIYVALHVRGAPRLQPWLPPVHTHWTAGRKREKNRSSYNYEEKKSLWKEEKQKHGGEKTRLKPTNLFHPPRRVQTDSILDLGRFQGESVRHVHTQHCHVSGRLPPLTAACLSAVRVSRKIFSGRTVVLLGVFFSCRESGAPRLNFCCSCCRKPARRSDWSKNFVTRSYLFGVSAVRHLAKAKDNTAAQQLRIH